MPKDVCDTMIWYYLGDGRLNKEDYSKRNLTLTFISIDEAATSFHLINHPEYARKALQAMMELSQTIIYEPSLIYLAKLANPDMLYEPLEAHKDLLEATRRIANGENILPERIEDMKEWLESKHKILQDFADFTNDKLSEIRAKITDRKKHSLEDTTDGNRNVVSGWVKLVTDGEYNLDNLDWGQVELFDKTMNSFFNELELHLTMKFQPNDFNDLTNLVYVQPGDKYFTLERRWLSRIKNAGMHKYIF